ncbi:ATP-binding protein [Marinomonas algarum]|uniref:histidine kinase n=1 Tax=Marinomonas algarum TaxID=2883105 RepID=A0A9X1LE47_9GAMM|nr:ATP-binding protein [Marinomonas algarum]MCB5160540.1 response regulator [Marinomonas algarum]
MNVFLQRFSDRKNSAFIALVVAACIFMGASALIFAQVVEHQKSMMSAAEEDALWASYQLDREALKLKNALQLLQDGFTSQRLDEAMVRFDILYSRIHIIETGQLRDLFDKMPQFEGALITLQNTMSNMDEDLFSEKGVKNIPTLIAGSALVQKQTELLVLESLASRSAEKVSDREDSLGLFLYLGFLIACLTFTMVFIIAMLFRQLGMAKASYKQSQKLAGELEDAVQSAEQALKVKSEFLATMSHEIRTPMNAVVGFSYLLLDGELEPKVREKVQRIQRSADNLLSIINSILDFSKLESGNMELDSQPFSLDELLEYLYQSNEVAAHKKGLELIVCRDFSLSDNCVGDAAKLKQVLTNLLSNAIKFTPQGRVQVTVSLSDPSCLVFEVEDTGIGIAEGVDVFDMFKQADSSTTRLYGGTGLGLSISRKLVELMGGSISFASHDKQGCLFTVQLPYCTEGEQNKPLLPVFAVLDQDRQGQYQLKRLNVKAEQKGQADLLETTLPVLVSKDWVESEKALLQQHNHYLASRVVFLSSQAPLELSQFPAMGLLTPSALHDKMADMKLMEQDRAPSDTTDCVHSPCVFKDMTILLAEDNKINASIATAIMQKMGATVVWVENGLKAYEEARYNKYDLIVMDIRMPAMDGYQASQKIMAALDEEKPPIIVLTADVFNIQKEDFSQFGIDDYLLKPVDPHLLMDKVETLIINDRLIKSTNRQSEYQGKLERRSLVAVLQQLSILEDHLHQGAIESESVLRSIIDQCGACSGVETLKTAIDDVVSYDYQDAILKVQGFKRCLYRDTIGVG